jgi:hypothetical protein
MKNEFKLRFFGDDSGESLKSFIKESASKAASETFDKLIPSEEKPIVAEDVVKIAAELLYTTPATKRIVTEEKSVAVVEEPKKQKTILESKFETLQKSLSEDLREYKQKIIEEVSKSASKQNPYYLGDSGSGEVKLLSLDDVETKNMSRQARSSYLANNAMMVYDTADKLFHFKYALNQDLLQSSNVYFNNIEASGNVNVGGQVFVTSGVTGNIDLTVSGNTSIGKDLTVSGNTILRGNLLVTGYTTTVNTSSLIISDALFHLNDVSTTSNVDLGFTGNYNDGTYRHAGLFRDSVDGVWKLFDGYTPETNTAVKILTNNASYVDAGLKVGNLTANGNTSITKSLTVTSNVTAGNLNTLGVANVGTSIITGLTASKPVFTDANRALTSSGTMPTNQGGTGLTSFTSSGIVYASSTSALTTGSSLQFDGTNLTVTGNVTAGNINTLGVANVGNSIVTALTASKPVFTDANKALTSSGTMPTNQGGTGLTTFTSGGAVYASSTSALTTGTLPTGSGGTGLTSFTSAGLVYASSTSALATGSTLQFDGTNFGVGLTPVTNNGVLQLGSYAAIKSLVESATITGAAPSSTTNFDWTTQAVQYYTSNATTNFTLNIRGNGTTSLNTVMQVGQSASIALMITNGSSAYYPNVFQIDGTTTNVNTKFLNGTTISSGNANSIDIYNITVIKTAASTYTVLVQQNKFA